MSQEKIKKKNKINKKALAKQEINILPQTEQNTTNSIENSINIDINNNNNKNIILNYGRYRIFSYNSKGDPLFLIGPDYSYFISMLIMNLIFFIFFNYLLLTFTKLLVGIIGVILNIIQLFFFIIASIKNPGLPKKEIQNEVLLNTEPDKYKRCNSCLFIVEKNKKYVHCNVCQICCEGYDHHCPWTSKCVGKGNIFYFNTTLTLVSIVFFYLILAFAFAKP